MATLMQPLVMPRDAFLFRPQPAHHATAGRDRHAPIRCTRSSRTRSTRPRPPSPPPRVARASREPPARPRRVTPVARSHRDEAAVLRWQRSRHGSRPREWHVHRESRPSTLAASRPLHAGRRAVARRPHATAAPRLPPPRVGKGVAAGTVPPPAPVGCSFRDDGRGPDAPASLRSRVVHARPIVTIPIIVRSFFLFRPQPAHHATARCIGRAAHPARPQSDLRSVERAAPSWRHRFCRAVRRNRRGPAARTAPPLHALPCLSVCFARLHVSPSRAPSRRLQRASSVWRRA